MKSYEELEKMFDKNEFRNIDKEKNGEKFYYLRTISRLEIAKKYFKNNKLKKEDLTSKFNKLLEDDKFELENIENFIIEEYKQQLENRKITTKKILDMFDNLSFFIYTRGQDPLLQDIYFIKF